MSRLDHAAFYPDSPGHKGNRDTGRAAAAGIEPRAGTIRARVLAAIRERPGTPEELADRMGEPVMNVRPRCSELAAKDLIEDSGERAVAMGGRKANRWKAKETR
jgi:predicted ArsR family transcriptional regulator